MTYSNSKMITNFGGKGVVLLFIVQLCKLLKEILHLRELKDGDVGLATRILFIVVSLPIGLLLACCPFFNMCIELQETCAPFAPEKPFHVRPYRTFE